jgi:hypothetical protein
MRLPLRAVRDHDVDRPQVQRQQCQSRAVLIARTLRARTRPALWKLLLLFFRRTHVKGLGVALAAGPTSSHPEQRS